MIDYLQVTSFILAVTTICFIACVIFTHRFPGPTRRPSRVISGFIQIDPVSKIIRFHDGYQIHLFYSFDDLRDWLDQRECNET